MLYLLVVPVGIILQYARFTWNKADSIETEESRVTQNANNGDACIHSSSINHCLVLIRVYQAYHSSHWVRGRNMSWTGHQSIAVAMHLKLDILAFMVSCSSNRLFHVILMPKSVGM